VNPIRSMTGWSHGTARMERIGMSDDELQTEWRRLTTRYLAVLERSGVGTDRTLATETRRSSVWQRVRVPIRLPRLPHDPWDDRAQEMQ
jgi:hypothetical protein